MLHPQWITPQWPAPPGVGALVTTRAGGYSRGPWGRIDGAGGMNLGLGGDREADVVRNRRRLRTRLPAEPRWLYQVNGTEVVDAAQAPAAAAADASYTTCAGVVCCVLVADCLPVLLAESRGRGVAAAHAGWRGMAAGVIPNTVAALRRAIGDEQARILAWLGPAIGPRHFLVGPEVREAMRARFPDFASAFIPSDDGKFQADLFALARQALAQAGVEQIGGGGLCTYGDRSRFYSFRRDGVTGRHAALIWLRDSPAFV